MRNEVIQNNEDSNRNVDEDTRPNRYKIRKMSASQLMRLGGRESLTDNRPFYIGIHKGKAM